MLRNVDPARILTLTNALVSKDEASFATAICGYIDPLSREIVYASAGHPPPVLGRRAGPAAFLDYGGVMLGAERHQAYTNVRIIGPRRGLFVLYTDGVTERSHNVIQGERRLLVAVDDAMIGGLTDAARAIEEGIFHKASPADDASIVAIAFGYPAISPAIVGHCAGAVHLRGNAMSV